MFGTLVETEGGGERRWGSVVGVRLGGSRSGRRMMRMGRPLRGFSSYGDTSPTWVFDDEGNVTMGSEPQATSTGGSGTLDAILNTISAVAPSLLGVVKSAIDRGVQPSGSNCPPGYAYYSPIVRRCFQTPGEMSAAESALAQARAASGGGSNTALLVGAGALALVGLVMFMRK